MDGTQMSGIKNYETQEEFTPEIHQALTFDIRDNPAARDILNYLTIKYGKDGQKHFLTIVEDDVKREFSKDPGPTLFPWTRAAVKTYITGGELHSQFGMGQIAALIGSALTALAQVGSSIYTSKLAANTQLKITKLQVEQAQAHDAAESQLIQQQINAQNAALIAQQAQAAATPNNPMTGTPILSSNGTQVAHGDMFGGMGGILMLTGLVVGVGYIIVTKLRN